MQYRKGHGELSVIEAVDNLSNMAEVDSTVSEPAVPTEARTEAQVSESMHVLSWRDPAYYAYNRERVKETFIALLKYMQDLYEKDKGQLRDIETQRGIQALMQLAGEAAQKIDKFTDIFRGEKEGSVSELKEFKELQQFYLTKVVQRFQTLMETEDKWQEEWGAEVEEAKLEASHEGLTNLESVRSDKGYELFLISKEDKKPYFNRSLLRHLQLVGQFDNLLTDGEREDPFRRIQMIKDRDVHASAKEILQLAGPYIDDFFKEALKLKQMNFVASINKALMALMLAANSRNLLQNTSGKSSLKYYADFHFYLRKALTSNEYRSFIIKPPALTDRFFHTLINLTHVLCSSFFLRVGSRQDMVAFIRMLIEKGSKGSVTQSQTSSPLVLWNTLLDDDSSLRYLLKQYPSGPLLNTLNLFEQDDQLKGYDPIGQQNLPSQMYTIAGDEVHISCLRLPSPTSQQLIGKAQIIDEFNGFIRSIGSTKRNQRHLLINLQDRTSWQEHARCSALEEVQKNAEFAHALIVVTLPKNTDFYLQSGPYIALNDAQDFLKQFEEQISSAEQCGFYFPAEIDQKEVMRFSTAAMKTIHSVFFEGKRELIHKNRLDFIEIFYMLLTLKLIEMCKPDTLSFTCKDTVDTGAAASVEIFALLRMMNDVSHWTKEEKDFLLWMVYAPALAVRERAIDIQRFNRMTSALTVVNAEIEAHYEATIAACSKLYELAFFKGLTVKEA